MNINWECNLMNKIVSETNSVPLGACVSSTERALIIEYNRKNHQHARAHAKASDQTNSQSTALENWERFSLKEIEDASNFEEVILACERAPYGEVRKLAIKKAVSYITTFEEAAEAWAYTHEGSEEEILSLLKGLELAKNFEEVRENFPGALRRESVQTELEYLKWKLTCLKDDQVPHS